MAKKKRKKNICNKNGNQKMKPKTSKGQYFEKYCFREIF